MNFFLPSARCPRIFPTREQRRRRVCRLFLILHRFTFEHVGIRGLFLDIYGNFLSNCFLIAFILLFRFFRQKGLFFNDRIHVNNDAYRMARHGFFLPSTSVGHRFTHVSSFVGQLTFFRVITRVLLMLLMYHLMFLNDIMFFLFKYCQHFKMYHNVNVRILSLMPRDNGTFRHGRIVIRVLMTRQCKKMLFRGLRNFLRRVKDIRFNRAAPVNTVSTAALTRRRRIINVIKTQNT